MFEWRKCWTVNQNWIDRNISSFQKDVCLTEIRYCNSTELAPCLCFAACKWIFSFLSSSAVKTPSSHRNICKNLLKWPLILLSNARNAWSLICRAAEKSPPFQTHPQWKCQQSVLLKTVLKEAHYQRWLMVQVPDDCLKKYLHAIDLKWSKNVFTVWTKVALTLWREVALTCSEEALVCCAEDQDVPDNTKFCSATSRLLQAC